MTATIEPRNGWHWREWLAEGAGSAIVLFAVVTAKDLAIRAGPPLSDLRWSIAIIAVVAGLAVGIVALSTLGRRSGAHLIRRSESFPRRRRWPDMRLPTVRGRRMHHGH